MQTAGYERTKPNAQESGYKFLGVINLMLCHRHWLNALHVMTAW